MASSGLTEKEKIEELEEQILVLEHSKLELIRATSTEIERLRTLIRTLTGVDSLRTLTDLYVLCTQHK